MRKRLPRWSGTARLYYGVCSEATPPRPDRSSRTSAAQRGNDVTSIALPAMPPETPYLRKPRSRRAQTGQRLPDRRHRFAYDARRQENQQLGLRRRARGLLEQIAEDRQIAEERNLRNVAADLFFVDPPD